MIQKQSAKGTAATVGAAGYKNKIVAGSAHPERNIERLNETDSSRDQGNAFISSFGAGGDPTVYVRDSTLGLLLTGVLGGDAVSGVGPYVHTITPANALPYFTIWRYFEAQTNDVYERFEDCVITSLTIHGEAGQPLTAQFSFMGRKAVRLASDPTSTITDDLQAPYLMAEGSASPGGASNFTINGTAAVATISSFDYTVDNNAAVQQTNDFYPYDIAPAKRLVTVGFDMIFETYTEYAVFHYGAGPGTTPTATIGEANTQFVFTKTAVTNIISLAVPKFTYEEFPLENNTDGTPITVAARGSANRNGVSAITTAIITNQIVAAY
jgi:hypothetical protein